MFVFYESLETKVGNYCPHNVPSLSYYKHLTKTETTILLQLIPSYTFCGPESVVTPCNPRNMPPSRLLLVPKLKTHEVYNFLWILLQETLVGPDHMMR